METKVIYKAPHRKDEIFHDCFPVFQESADGPTKILLVNTVSGQTLNEVPEYAVKSVIIRF